MFPSNIIFATAQSASSESETGSVKIKADNLYETTEPIMVLGEMSIVKGETVIVDISNGYESPVVIGVLKKKTSEYDVQVFHSADNDNKKWSKLLVKQNEVSLENSDKVKVTISNTITVQLDKATIKIANNGSISIDSASGQSVTINNHLQVR